MLTFEKRPAIPPLGPPYCDTVDAWIARYDLACGTDAAKCRYVIQALLLGGASSGVAGWYRSLDERTRSHWPAMVEALRKGLRDPSISAARVRQAMLAVKQAIRARVGEDGNYVYEWEPLATYRERFNQVYHQAQLGHALGVRQGTSSNECMSCEVVVLSTATLRDLFIKGLGHPFYGPASRRQWAQGESPDDVMNYLHIRGTMEGFRAPMPEDAAGARLDTYPGHWPAYLAVSGRAACPGERDDDFVLQHVEVNRELMKAERSCDATCEAGEPSWQQSSIAAVSHM
jgi:hypothetical protein